MADAILAKAQDLVEGQIDFEGQRKTELLSTFLLTVVGIAAFGIGLAQQSIHLTLWIGLGGTLVTFFMVVPPWPAYNEDPQPWLLSTKTATGPPVGTSIVVDGKKIN